MRFSIFAAAAAFAGIAHAYTQPVGDQPKGNPIVKPGLDEQVPVGKPYEIQWDPTTPKDGTVTLLLLRGPSENIKPLYPIAEKIPNSGSYSWTPKTDLVADTTHYGIQLIVDATGQYQYTSQFGIKNKRPHYPSSGGHSYPTGASNSTAPYPTGTGAYTVSKYTTAAGASSTEGVIVGTATSTQVVAGATSNGASTPSATTASGGAAKLQEVAIGAVVVAVAAFAGL